MAKTIATFEVVAKGKNISIVAKDTAKLGKEVKKTGTEVDKTSGSMNRLNKNANSVRRGLHGAAGMSSNATKNFAKMNQGMGGSTGLVAAYATLAANVFALSAAFNALRQAAQVETLTKGFNLLAAEVGRSGTQVADKLKEITNNALSTAEALRASAVALTAGFSTTQIDELGKVAKNASIALGRNLGDSIDRLFRGVAKLEPEILDELGILVRLDTAVENYAAKLGKAGSDLSDFERRQAFLNATIEQGTLKYGKLEGLIQANAYDKLAATFGDLTKSIIGLANTAIAPLINLLATSSTVLLGALIVFGSTVVTKMFPVLTELGVRQAASADAATAAAAKERDAADSRVASMRKIFAAATGGGQGAQQLRNQIQQNKQIRNYDKALGSLNKSEKLRARNLSKYHGEELKRKQRELADIRKQIALVEELKRAEQGRAQAQIKAQVSRAQAGEQRTLAGGTMLIGAGGGIEGFKQASSSLEQYRKRLLVTSRIQGDFTKTDGKYSFTSFGKQAMFGFKLASGGARLFGAALVNAIPLIGQIIFIAGILTSTLGSLFSKFKKNETAADKLGQVIKEQPEVYERYQKVLKNSIELNKNINKEFDITAEKALKVNASTRFAAGGFSDFNSAFQANLRELSDDNISKFDAAMVKLGKIFSNLGKAIAESGIGEVFKSVGQAISGSAKFVANEVTALVEGTDADKALVRGEDLRKETELLQNQFNKFAEESPVYAAVLQRITQGLTVKEMVDIAQKFDQTGDKVQAGFDALAGASDVVNASIESVEGNSKSLVTGLEDLDKRTNKYFTSLAKQNDFLVFAKNVESLEKNIISVIEQTDNLTLTQQQLSGELGSKSLKTLEQLGLKLEDLVTDFKENEDGSITLTGTLTELGKKFREIGELEQTIASQKQLNTVLDQAAQAAKNLALSQSELIKKQETLTRTGQFQLTPKQEIELAKQKAELEADAAEREYKSKLNIFILEQTLARLKLEANTTLEESEKERLRNLYTQIEIATLNLLIDQKRTKEVKAQSELLSKISTAGQTGTTIERIGAVGEAGTFESGSTAEQLTAAAGILNPMMEQLKELGPEGELVNIATAGIFSIAEAFNIMGQSGIKSAESLEQIGGILATASNIMQAASKAQIAEIDNQIAAEKKRDGKSTESLAKISAMEKKKDDMQRKAFNRNKKMQMAQTVVNTASSIAKALTELPFPANVALAVMMGALGAAQLSIISRQKYQGAAGSVEKPTTNLNIGGRSNAVDVSQSATAGELSYLRGGRTTGSNIGGAGASFPGAAMGRKSYADGGVVVGERGPEVIAPSTPVDIIPNYALDGQTTNVNFTINALDAAGVEDVLMGQQGNIIRMIRQAANENGENFLPNVDTMAYGSKT